LQSIQHSSKWILPDDDLPLDGLSGEDI